MSVTALPEQLSDDAREFAGRTHELLIDGEFVAASDGRSFETLDPATGRADHERRAGRRRRCRQRGDGRTARVRGGSVVQGRRRRSR